MATVPVVFGSYSVPWDWWITLYDFVRTAGHVTDPFDGNCDRITAYLAIGAAESGWRVDADGAYICDCCACGECSHCDMCSLLCDDNTKSPYQKAQEHYGGNAYTSHGPYQVSVCGGQASAWKCAPAELHDPATHLLIALPPIRDAINNYWDDSAPIETNVCNAALGSGHPCYFCLDCSEYRIQNIIGCFNNMRQSVCAWLAGNAPPPPVDPNCEPSPMPDLPFGTASARPMPPLPPDVASPWPMPPLPNQGSPCASGGGGDPTGLQWQCPLTGSFAVSQPYGGSCAAGTYWCDDELPDAPGNQCGHSGVDLDTFGVNIDVRPAAGWGDGTTKVWVAMVGYDAQAGNYVVLRHADNYYNQMIETAYFHLDSVAVQQNTWIDWTTIIGQTGTTGWSSGIHLHFEVRVATLPDITCGCAYPACAQRMNPARFVPCVA